MNKPKPYPILEPEIGFVNDVPVAYIPSRGQVPLSGMTSLQKMELSRRGVSKHYLENFKKRAALDYDGLAGALSVTRATLINKKGEEKFSGQISERIISLADLYAFGYEVFEDHEKFNQWMQAPNQALDGQPPLQIADSLYGREEIRSLIGRIAYGVFS